MIINMTTATRRRRHARHHVRSGYSDLRRSTERKNAYAEWLASEENPRFTQVIVNRLWKRVDMEFSNRSITQEHTEINQPELLSYLEKLMRELDYDIRVFQSVLSIPDCFAGKCIVRIIPQE